MTSYERVMNRLAGKPVDYLPNLSLTMMFAAREVGANYRDFCADFRILAEGALRCHERYGIDMVCAISDPMREAEGFGTEIVMPESGVPYPKKRRVSSVEDIDTLKVIDPSHGRRMSDRVEAVRLLKERVRGDVPVIGWVEGAMAESCDLMDLQEFLILLLEEPQAARQLMNVSLEQGILFARAQVDAGADIIGVGDAVSSLIGPKLYEEFAFPYQRQMVEQIHAMGAKVKLHICGNLNPVLPITARTGADIIDLDYMVDIRRAAELFGQNVSICGNFDPVEVVYQGTPPDIYRHVGDVMGISDRNRNMIAPGCEIPRDTARENVRAIHEAIVAYSRGAEGTQRG